MVAAYELLVATHAIRNLVREGKSRQIRNVVATSQTDGMQTLEAALNALVAAGIVHFDVALGASLRPTEIQESRADPQSPAHRRSGRTARR
jgi:twitching motility protein PilT